MKERARRLTVSFLIGCIRAGLFFAYLWAFMPFTKEHLWRSVVGSTALVFWVAVERANRERDES